MKKYINWFFLCFTLFPFAFALTYVRAGASWADVSSNVFQTFRFGPVADFLNSMFNTMGGNFSSVATNLCSWVFFSLVSYLAVDLITFLPVLCFDAFTKRGEKK